MLPSVTRVTLRLLALLGQVTWTKTVCFRGGVRGWVYLNGYQCGLRAAKIWLCVRLYLSCDWTVTLTC